MSLFFISIYNFFKTRRIILISLLIIILLFSGLFISKLSVEEDISKAASGNKKIDLILKQSKISDKLIINISNIDSTKPTNSDSLISFAEALSDSLNSPKYKYYISDIMIKVSDSLISNMMEILYNNLPLFLADNDYKKIDSLIDAKTIDKSIEKNYRNILSPISFSLKKFITRDPIGISSLAFLKLKQLQFDDNFEIIDGYIFTKDKKHLLIFINPKFAPSKTSENSVFINSLENTISNLTLKNKTIKVDYFGATAVAMGNATQIKKDVAVTVSISILIILLFIGWFFRRVSIPFISFLPAIFGGSIALSIIFILKSNVSVIALALGSVLLGIIVDYALYIFSLYKSKGSFEEVLKDMSLTIFLCSITTAVAFFSLLFVKSEVLRDLGLFAGLSILAAAVFSLIILPHTIKSKNNLSNLKNRNTFIDKISNYRFESNSILVAIIIIITISFLFISKKVSFETDMNKMNFMSEKLKNAEKNLNKVNNISTEKSVYIFATGKNIEDVIKLNEQISSTLECLSKEKYIKNYSSISTFLISDSIQKARINKWNIYWSNIDKQNLKKNISESSSKYGFSKNAFNDFFNLIDKKYKTLKLKDLDKIKKDLFKDRISENKELVTIATFVKVNNNNRDSLYSRFSKNENIVVFDKYKLTTTFVENIKKDFELLVNLCLILVTIVLIISFGRIETGLIASIPMFVSWLWTLGIMGVFNLKFNIFNIIISTFIFGLGVDYSILMMRGLLLDYKYGQKELSSYKTSIFLSVFTTIVGVGVLIFAVHPALNSIAIISIIGLISVVIISYTIEPIIFNFLTKINSRNRYVPMTFLDLLFSIMAFSIFFSGCLIMNVVLPFVLILPVKKKTKKLIMHYLMMALCWFEIYAMFNVKKRLVNYDKNEFRKPSLIIANHQSHIDLLIILMLNPKIIVVTNNWVWNNPVYSFVIRFLDFYSTNEGFDVLIEKLKLKIEDGYSILIFPEGSRSDDYKIKRFHKGAFLIAEKLNLDIKPILFHGIGECMSKNENFLKSGTITMKFLPLIKNDDLSFGNNYSERTKSIQKLCRTEYSSIIDEYATPKYFKNKLIKNYIFKGPILEWYLRIKIKLEKNYDFFNNIIPKEAEITDIGCGYGFLSYMLSFISEKRKIIGIDYDKEKIAVANNCNSKSENINFICADAFTFEYKQSDVFILNDMLHYLSAEKQENIIQKCVEKLKPNGIIIIRDGDSDMMKRHKGTKLTEFFSTNIGFNKMGEKSLTFTSSKKIKELTTQLNLNLKIVDETKHTSNIIFIISKK